MILIPLPSGNMEEWAQQITQVLQLELERELEAAKPPLNSIVIYPDGTLPEGWSLYEEAGMPELPSGLVYIVRG